MNLWGDDGGSPKTSLWDDIAGTMKEGFNIEWVSTLLESANSSSRPSDVVESVDGPLYGAADADTLCPMLVVDEDNGITLTVFGQILPEPQRAVLQVKQKMRPGRPDRNLPGVGGMLLKIFVAENGAMDGILVESPLGFQVSFLDTTGAVGENPTGIVDILYPQDDIVGSLGPDVLHYKKEAGNIFAVCSKAGFGVVEVRRVEKAGSQRSSGSFEQAQFYVVENRIDSKSPGLNYRNSKLVKDVDNGRIAKWGSVVKGIRDFDGAWLKVEDVEGSKTHKFLPMKYEGARVLRPQGQLLLTVHLETSGRSGNVVDSDGQLVASMQTRRNDGGEQMMVLEIATGVDAGLVVSSITAALKLRNKD